VTDDSPARLVRIADVRSAMAVVLSPLVGAKGTLPPILGMDSSHHSGLLNILDDLMQMDGWGTLC
jgi:hypothetical protein